jgi:hypothetical protein
VGIRYQNAVLRTSGPRQLRGDCNEHLRKWASIQTFVAQAAAAGGKADIGSWKGGWEGLAVMYSSNHQVSGAVGHNHFVSHQSILAKDPVEIAAKTGGSNGKKVVALHIQT